jgi:uncharacterized protein (UPF0297 family)
VKSVDNLNGAVFSDTQKVNISDRLFKTEVRDILYVVYCALKEKGYDPINQIVGYILSGDPTYITSHKNARGLIAKLERDELLEEIVDFYLNENIPKA